MNTRWQLKTVPGSKSAAVIVLSVVLSQFETSSRAAENPARFLAVTNWYATFTRTLQSSGTYNEPVTQCVYTWSFSHAGGISSQLKTLIPPLPGIDPVWSDAGSTNISLNFSLQDRGSQTCGDDTDTYEASGGPAMRVLQWCGLRISVAATNYTLEPGYLVGPYSGTVNGDPFPGSVVTWFPPSTNPIVEPLPASGMVLQGSRRYSLSQLDYLEVAPVLTIAASGSPLGSGNPQAQQALNGELVLTWTLTPVLEELELVIEPADYETWLPKGDVDDWRNPGNVMFVVAALQTKDGRVPQSRAKRFRFELLEVSTEKGVCMNRPAKAFANDSPDLRFPSDLNQPPGVDYPLVLGNGGLTATTPDGEYYIVEAAVASYDFGAYGKLKVTAEVNGEEIVGYLNTDGTKTPKPILIPRRQPNSHIADQWKEDKHASGKGDSADDEEKPAGDGHKGDGLTLYEEYRGFSEGGIHFRANPEKKDFFVSDGIRSVDSIAGIGKFTQASGLEVHWKMQAHEFEVDLSLGGPVKTTVNFNHGTDHVVDQHGIIIAQRDVSSGLSFADADNQGGTPAQYQRVWIDPSAYGWRDITRSDGSRSFRHFGSANIAHELAHTCAVWHHGQGDPTVMWFNETVVANGQTNAVITEFGIPIELRIEGDFGYVANPIPEGGSLANIWIGIRQGQHSGDEECFMRYSAAYAYRRGTIRYIVNGDEPSGFGLCDSPKGTGVNDALREFGSRYDDAAPSRGKCRTQICVNDLYNGSASHNR